MSGPDPRRRRLRLLLLLGALSLLLLGFQLPAGGGVRALAATPWHLVRNVVLGPASVGIQVGHLDAGEHPEELASLRTSTGAQWNDMLEVDVNEAVAVELARLLGEEGVRVTLLPATVPPRYRADLVLSIHADSSPDPGRRGYKSATFRGRSNPWEERLKELVDDAYLRGSGLPDDHANVTAAMLDYYAFNRRFRHSVASGTPALIVELGYLSHPEDRRLLTRPEKVAELLAQGVRGYLRERGRLR